MRGGHKRFFNTKKHLRRTEEAPHSSEEFSHLPAGNDIKQTVSVI